MTNPVTPVLTLDGLAIFEVDAGEVDIHAGVVIAQRRDGKALFLSNEDLTLFRAWLEERDGK